MVKEKKVAVIISTYNQKEMSEICISSLIKKTSYQNYNLFFIDDSGTKEIGKDIQKKFPRVEVISNEKNLGFSKSNNEGMKAALKEYAPDYFLLLNDDTEIIQGDWLSKMIDAGESNEKIGILGCRLIYPDGSLQNIGGYLRGWEITKTKDSKKKLFEVDHVMGACFLIKKEVVEKIGLLDEIYSPFLLEETDYCLRAKERGFKILTVNSVKLIHKKGKSIDSLKNKSILFIRFKNDLIFSFRHMKIKDAFFRAFVYLPLVALLKKNHDEDSLKLRNFRLRKDFPINIIVLIWSYFYVLFRIKAGFKKYENFK